MNLTIEDLKLYEKIANECIRRAEDFNDVVQNYGDDFHPRKDADVCIEYRNGELQVLVHGFFFDSSEYGCYSGDKEFTLEIPFAFIEDPDTWADNYREKQRQLALKAIEVRAELKRKKEEEAEAYDRAEYKRLKEKYEGSKETLDNTPASVLQLQTDKGGSNANTIDSDDNQENSDQAD